MTFALGIVCGWLLADHVRIRREFLRLERFVVGGAVRRWASDKPVVDDVHAYLRGER